MTHKECKQRYWDKKYAEAPWIPCACGCDQMLKAVDHYGRPVSYINGHNTVQKYYRKTEYKRAWDRRNRESRKAYKKRRGQKRKGKLLKVCGGRCVGCGRTYDRTNAAMFDFHHRIPEEKEFALTQSKINDNSWEAVLTEAEKCDIMCACCHRMVHSDEY